jgi:hypothetical protein
MCSQCKEYKALVNDADVLEKHIASNNCGEKKRPGSKVTFNQQLASLRDRVDNFEDPWEPADPVQIRAQIQKWHNEAQHKGHTTTSFVAQFASGGKLQVWVKVDALDATVYPASSLPAAVDLFRSKWLAKAAEDGFSRMIAAPKAVQTTRGGLPAGKQVSSSSSDSDWDPRDPE